MIIIPIHNEREKNMHIGKRRLAALAAVVAACAASAQAQSCDVDDYVTKAIGIEEPWVENAGYLFAQYDHAADPQALTLAPELESRFSDRVGMELDLPAYTAQAPLGRGASAFGPLAAGLKFGALHSCDMGRGRATLLSVEVEGQYWADRNTTVLPGEGNSATLQAMWAQLWYPWFTTGEVGYTQRIGGGVASGGFVNAALGRALDSAHSVQIEVELDNQATLADGSRGFEGSVMPQFAWRPSPRWLFALGEQASLQQGALRPQWSTWLMVEREFTP
jgi:hypothetical protein